MFKNAFKDMIEENPKEKKCLQYCATVITLSNVAKIVEPGG